MYNRRPLLDIQKEMEYHLEHLQKFVADPTYRSDVMDGSALSHEHHAVALASLSLERRFALESVGQSEPLSVPAVIFVEDESNPEYIVATKADENLLKETCPQLRILLAR